MGPDGPTPVCCLLVVFPGADGVLDGDGQDCCTYQHGEQEMLFEHQVHEIFHCVPSVDGKSMVLPWL